MGAMAPLSDTISEIIPPSAEHGGLYLSGARPLKRKTSAAPTIGAAVTCMPSLSYDKLLRLQRVAKLRVPLNKDRKWPREGPSVQQAQRCSKRQNVVVHCSA